MDFKIFKRVVIILPVIAALVACQSSQRGIDAEDETNPYFRQAAKYELEQNYQAAIKEYESALQANPMLAKAHLQLGLLYAEKLGDPISGIYHLQRYIQARPNAQDKDQIQMYIDKAKVDLVTSLPNSPLQNADEFARVSKENIDLKQSLAQMQKEMAEKDSTISQLQNQVADASQKLATTQAQLVQTQSQASQKPVAPVAAQESSVAVETKPAVKTSVSTADSSANTDASSSSPSTQTGKSSTETPVAAQSTTTSTTQATAPATATKTAGETRYHVIQKGDSLWKIASKYYPGEAKEGVEKIKQANPEATSNERNLKLGQKLIIPE